MQSRERESIIIEDETYIVQEGFFFALISYVCFLVVISLVFKRTNKFALFHARQGLVLFVLESTVVILRLLLGVHFDFFYKVSMLIFLFLSLWGIFAVLLGKYKRLPLVGSIAERVIL